MKMSAICPPGNRKFEMGAAAPNHHRSSYLIVWTISIVNRFCGESDAGGNNSRPIDDENAEEKICGKEVGIDGYQRGRVGPLALW
jgi:hypothetical protein